MPQKQDGTLESDFKEIIRYLSSPNANDILIHIEHVGDKEWVFDAKTFLTDFVSRLKESTFLDHVKYVLQRRNPGSGQWQTKGLAIQGKKLAHRLLNKQKVKYPHQEWRTVPKAIADAYKQGWLDRDDLSKGINPATMHKNRRSA